MLLWSDKSGKKLFKDPYIDIFKENRLVDIFQRVKGTGDDRSRSILINLILENQTDTLLGCLINNYEKYLKETNPSFYNKLSLLDSFDMLPEQIFKSINCLREIRNCFAHNLYIDKFDDLDQKIKTKIDHVILHTTFDKENQNTLDQKIFSIEFHAASGLDNYEPNFRLLSDQINGEEFKKSLDVEYKNRLKKQHEYITEFMKSQRGE
jgi:hypothetical protein